MTYGKLERRWRAHQDKPDGFRHFSGAMLHVMRYGKSNDPEVDPKRETDLYGAQRFQRQDYNSNYGSRS